MENEENKPSDPDRNPNGTWKKGHGITKPKGSISVKREILEEVGEYFVNEGLDAYTALLDEMLNSKNPVQKLEGMKRYEVLLEYFIPKLSRQDGTVEHKGDIPITINKKYNDGKID